MFLQDPMDLHGSRGSHLGKDGLPRCVANGAGCILPHHGGLVHHALQGLIHEAIPIGDALVGNRVDDVVHNVEGKAALELAAVGPEKFHHHLHERRQEDLDEEISARMNQGTGHIDEAEAHLLPRDEAIALQLIVLIADWCPSSHWHLSGLILGEVEACQHLENDRRDVPHNILCQDTLAGLTDNSGDPHGPRLHQAEGSLIKVFTFGFLRHRCHHRPQKLPNKLLQHRHLCDAMLHCSSRTSRQELPGTKCAFAQIFGEPEVEQW
mmetsp:Transcript_29205/g.63505  ORF Transcript_29205/g.63505 Transcript_29205/m.63505 type:complete len:266 (+) Transcript_29205:564-1361(+)